ncbi:MAG: hypothetical protein K940chlam5_00920 [Candidatus Anoxychlamydiales bacterium]|nr:hypothetical protein [Candidatus Anoxychlamydiales bacterium]
MASRKKTILIDFDRVVHKYSHGFMDGTIYDEPVPGAIDAIKKLQKAGFKVIIFTTKSTLGDKRNKWIKVWLKTRGLYLEVTHTKYPAIAIIDDRAIRFTHWRDILNYFL